MKNVIIFTSGAVVGAIGTWLSVKTYYKVKSDKEIEELDFMYHERLNELKETYALYGNNSIKDPEIKLEEGNKSVNGLEDTVSSLSEGEGAKSPSKDYTAYFKKGEDKLKQMGLSIKGGENDMKRNEDIEEIDASELESPEDDEEMDDEEDGLQQEDYEMYLVNEEHRKAVAENRPPYMIESGEFGNIPGYDTMDLFYYRQDCVLADEDKEEVDVPELFVGDLLNSEILDRDGIESVFVRSDVTMTDVEVHLLDEKFYR